MTEIYKIKPLVWHQQNPDMLIARTLFWMYSARKHPKGFSLHRDAVFMGIFHDLEEAKTAAEAHYAKSTERNEDE